MISNLLNAIWYQSLVPTGFRRILVTEAGTGFELRAPAFRREASDAQRALLKLGLR